MPGIRVRENEGYDSFIRRFKRAVEKSGVLSEMRRRESFESPSEQRKRAKAAAVKRFRKKQSREAKGEREKGGNRSKSRTAAATRGGARGRGQSSSAMQSQH